MTDKSDDIAWAAELGRRSAGSGEPPLPDEVPRNDAQVFDQNLIRSWCAENAGGLWQVLGDGWPPSLGALMNAVRDSHQRGHVQTPREVS